MAMIRHEWAQSDENLVYYTFKSLESFPEMSCVVSTRLGGVSRGHLHSLNLSFRVGDDEQAVITNRERFYAAAEVDPESVSQAQLVHGARIALVTENSPTGLYQRFSETDGLLTNVPNRPLFIPVADCAAVAFFDPQRRVVGMLHAGWKGVIARIVPQMVATMRETFDCRSDDIYVAVSPAIGPCCYEVREDLVAIFTEAFPSQAQRFFHRYEDGKITLDMWTALRWQAQESGVCPEHIDVAEICTACHTDEFYSHRAEHGKTGRFAGLIVLR